MGEEVIVGIDFYGVGIEIRGGFNFGEGVDDKFVLVGVECFWLFLLVW